MERLVLWRWRLACCSQGHQCDRTLSKGSRCQLWIWQVCNDPSLACVYFTDAKLHRSGTFNQPLFTADGITCNGVETIDGTRYYADKVVLAAGAWSPTLVDLEDQCVSKVCLRYTSCPSSYEPVANYILAGVGLCSYSAHTRGSGQVQKHTRGIRWRIRLLLRAQRVGPS